jgi:hypothetical protein
LATLTTSRCRTFGQPEFRLEVDTTAVVEPDVKWFVRTLEDWVEGGERFAAGQTVEVGWSVLKVEASPDGTLSLLEPDFVHMPVRWIESVTSSLQHLRLQKDVCESFFDSDALDCPSCVSHGIVCSRFQDSKGLLMDRQASSPPDSGWFIGCLDEGHDHNDPNELRRMSLYEAVLGNRAALPPLGLPARVLARVEKGKLAVFVDGRERAPRPGSFVHALGQ